MAGLGLSAAGLTKQATAGYGLKIEQRLTAAYCGLSIPYLDI